VPEGDTVWRTARRLDEALAGRRIVAADLRWPDRSTADLRGRRTLEVVSRGKHLLHRLEGGLTLHSHLRMEGRWSIERTEGLTPARRHSPDLRALVATEDWTALGLRLGELDLVPTLRESELVGHLGPDLLAPDWGEVAAAQAVGNVRAFPGTVAEALLDQRNVAGLGTIWVAQTLFAERVHPWAATSSLSADTLSTIIRRAHALLDAARREGTGTRGGPRESGLLSGRVGRPCRRCGGVVRVASVGAGMLQRSIAYCPTCQGGLAPTDAGGLRGPRGSARRPLRDR
jgi:endonuclease-8